jgi:intraflagellar transport protein 74
MGTVMGKKHPWIQLYVTLLILVCLFVCLSVWLFGCLLVCLAAVGGARAGGPIAALGGRGFPGAAAPAPGLQLAPPGMRPPTNAGNRPGSSAGAPIGMRPPTSAGGGMGMGAAGGPAIPLQTDVNVVVRPVTGMTGVTGMPTTRLGPGRVVADKTYYLTELNKKLNDINRELDAMRFEMERTANDNTQYAALERKYETVMKEVRSLEGQLADFNLAFDKLRTNTNVSEIQDLYQHLKSRNEHEKRTVDDVFLKCTVQEKQIREIEDRISNLHSQAAQRIASLGEEKQQEYVELQDELAGISKEIVESENELGHLEREIASYEETMKSEAYQIFQKGQSLAKENQQLQKQKQELQDELNSTASPAEVKERLTQKIKDATAETADLEKSVKKLESSIEKLSDTLRSKETDLGEAKKLAQKAKKYEAVYERDAKMVEFLNSFSQIRAEEQQKKRQVQDTIVALLKHISKGLAAGQTLQSSGADAEKLGEMKDEVSFKAGKLADAQKTLSTLQTELEKRKEELDKIEQLDSKISTEISQLQEKMQSMNSEMAGFKSEDELKDVSVQAKKDLLVENQRVKKQREAIKVQVALVSAEAEKKSKELQSNETWKRFENLEQKLKTHAGAVFTLQEFIQTKKRESDYEGLLKECAEVTKQINTILVAQK